MKKVLFFLITACLIASNFLAKAQNNALDFDDTDDYVSCGAINLSGSQITLEAWIKPVSFQSSSPYITNILGEEGAGSSAFLRLGDASLANNKLQFVLWIGSAQTKLDGVTALSANVWYHVATTYDGSNMRIYINGIEDASKSQTGSITANSTFYLSQPEAGRYFDGLLDEVRVLNDARSESEIRQNMYRELPNPSETNLVAYYKFNETSGIIADNAQGNASYDGALTNYGSQSGYWQTSTVIDAPKKCLDFDGVDDFVEIGSNFGLGTNTLSVECWVYIPNVSEKGTFINVGGSANGYAIGVGGTTFEDNGNKLIYINDMKTWHSTGTDIGIGWHHVAYTIDASNNTIIYLDGINVHSFTETPLTPSNAAYIGSSDNVGGRLFTGGKIDEVRIWNTARSATEIRDEMCNNLMGDESGLVGYYRCDFGSDLTLYDQTSSDNNGTLTNMDNSDWLTSYAMVLAEDATDVEGTSFTANWDCPGSNSSFDDGYTIEYSTTSDFSSGNATTTASSSETSKSITGLTSRTAYYYHVSGKRSGSATLEYSNVQSLTTIPQAPLYCLDFDGSNDYVDCGNISLSGSAITMECWVNVDAFQSSPPYISQLIGTESESNSAFLRLGDADISAGNKIEFVLNLGGVIQQLTSVSTLDIDRWYHIAGTYDGSTMIIYINGELDASDNQSGSVVSNSTFSIGAQYDGSNDGRHLDGSLDEVRVWSTARTATEISDNMCNAIITEDVSGLVAYYRCDHGSGTTLYDQASNESNGTFGGSPSWINSYAMVLAEDATSVTNAGFTANWDCPGTVSNFDYGYTIDYSTSVDFSSSTTLTASSSETSKTITGLTANTPYYYRVSGDRTVSDDPQYSNVKSLTTSASFSPVVTSNLDDGGTGTLRYIIANCGTGDEITFNLSSGDEIITIGSQIIVEANPKSITIDGDNTVGSGTDVSIQVTTPGVSIYRVFEFNPGTGYPISLKNMTLKGGNISGTAYDGHSGGSLYIYNCQSFTLENVTIEGSTATNGGGIYIFNSPVTLINCEISNTQAASSGGGIYNTDDQLFTLTSSSFSNCTANNGGGLSLGGPTTASDITIDNCTATFYGGGIYNYRNLTLTDSKITNNSAGSNGGGIYCEFNQSLSIIGSTISGNSSTSKGGGLYVSAEDNNQTSLNNSTVSNNSSADGGGIYAYSYDSEDPYVLNLILSNCTMSGNTCSSNGAGVYATDDNSAATNVYLTNSIVTYNYKSDNSAYVDLFNSNATFYGNYNIIGGLALSGSNNTNYSYTNGLGAGLFDSYTEILAGSIYKPVLADNGGPTETVALSSTSTAISSGVRTGEYESSGTKYVFHNGTNWVKVEDGSTVISSGVTEIETDQRGYSRNDSPSIGAFEYDAINIWEGAASSSWSDGANWSANTLPLSSVNVSIPSGLTHYPVIATEGTVTCNDLSVISGASLTIKSDVSGTGSLIVEGTASGNVTVERYLTHNKWHYIAGQTNISGNFNTLDMGLTEGTNKDQFYRWDEAYETSGTPGTWIDILNGNGSGTLMDDENFIACKGYVINYITTDKTLSLSGVPYYEDQGINITKTSGSTNPGANLVGNPFTSTIAANSNASANSFLSTNSGILSETKNAIYLWNEQVDYSGNRDDYTTISNSVGAAYLEPGQAFMVVKRDDGTSSLAFNTNMRQHGSATFYKNSVQNEVSRFYMSVESQDGLYNEILIAFMDGMTKGLDISYDAGKLKGNPDIALYTKLVEDIGVDFAHQALPPLNGEKLEVKIGLDVSKTGNYTFKIKQSENFDETTTVKLEDKETGNLVDFREIEEYSFNINQSGQIRERFILHFNNATGIEDQTQEPESIRFYVYENKLFIIDKKIENGTIQLFNMLGQPVLEKQYSEAVNVLDLNLKTGYYVVRIITDKNTISGKIFIE